MAAQESWVHTEPTMDYRAFLSKPSTVALPYPGGSFVFDAQRRYRIAERVRPGWWRFELSGRRAVALEEVAAEPLPEPERHPEGRVILARVRGHLAGGFLFTDGAQAEVLALVPPTTYEPDEPARFSPCTARRWHSGDLVYEALDFESEAEDKVRCAYQDHTSLAGISGVPATLRAAFGFALVERAALAVRSFVMPVEVRGHLLAIAEGGPAEAQRTLAGLLARRATDQAGRVDRAMPQAAQAPYSAPSGGRSGAAASAAASAVERAERALAAAGAELLDTRERGDALEVTYRFLGQRFQSLVHAATLQIMDAGICLDGCDDMVTLESLPSVIREAMESGELVITRRHAHDAGA